MALKRGIRSLDLPTSNLHELERHVSALMCVVPWIVLDGRNIRHLHQYCSRLMEHRLGDALAFLRHDEGFIYRSMNETTAHRSPDAFSRRYSTHISDLLRSTVVFGLIESPFDRLGRWWRTELWLWVWPAASSDRSLPHGSTGWGSPWRSGSIRLDQKYPLNKRSNGIRYTHTVAIRRDWCRSLNSPRNFLTDLFGPFFFISK